MRALRLIVDIKLYTEIPVVFNAANSKKLHDRLTFPQFVHEFNLWSDFHSDELPPRGRRAPSPLLTEHKETKGGSPLSFFFCIIKSNLEHLHLNLWTVLMGLLVDGIRNEMSNQTS